MQIELATTISELSTCYKQSISLNRDKTGMHDNAGFKTSEKEKQNDLKKKAQKFCFFRHKE